MKKFRQPIMQVLIATLFLGSLTALPNIPADAGTWSDGFEGDNTDSWQLLNGGAATLKVEDGELSLEVHNHIVSYLRLIGSNQWKNYTLTVRVKILKIFGSFVDAGVMVHERNLRNHYYFFIADKWAPKDWNKKGEAPYPGTPREGQGAFRGAHGRAKAPLGKRT